MEITPALEMAATRRANPIPPASVGQQLRDTLLILCGIASAAFGVKGFLMSSHFIDGGVTGISMLLSAALGWPLALLVPLINLPFIALGYRQIGLGFALRSAVAIAGFSVALAIMPFPDVTPDLLLTSVFGGLFIGAGIGLAMRGGAVLDGTEILALLVSRTSPLLKVSDVVLLLNVVIFGVAVFVLGVQPALYSILTYVSASKALDFIVQGVEQYTGVTIISATKAEAIRRTITVHLGRGVTIYQGRGGYGNHGAAPNDLLILFTVVTRLELPQLRAAIQRLDPEAFVIQHVIEDTHGGMIKKRPLH